jgi:hypothetical protein
MRIAHRLIPGLLAGSLLVGTTSGVLAAKTKAGARWAAFGGQVSNLSGNTFSLTVNPKAVAKGKAAKTLQVTLAANAKLKPRKGTTAPLAGGDYAVIVGTRIQTALTANHVIYSSTAFNTARMVAILRANHTLAVLKQHRASGTVQSSAGTTLVILTKAQKTLTFQLSSTTKFRANGQVTTVAPTFSMGQKVAVAYTVNKATKQLTAIAVALLA